MQQTQQRRNDRWPYLACCLIVLLGISPEVVFAQQVAFIQQEPTKEGGSVNQSSRLLKDILRDMEARYGIYFMYDSDQLKDQRVSPVNSTGKIEKQLSTILTPVGLHFKKVGNIYVITANPHGEIIRELKKHSSQLRNDDPAVREEALSSLQSRLSAIKQLASLTVKGKVTADNGEVLPGVSIILKGTTNGTATNSDGSYALTVPDGNGVLVFSFIGYTPKEVAINNQTTLDVSLAPDVKSLGEVIIVGYGEQKKATVTGSVASITNKELKTTTNGNVTNMLAGKLPGLRVTQRTGEPGNYASDYDIRGFGNALIIVDGVQRDNFNRLDPNEIESISVLKDASAAVYGVRAANGVILITTKRGKAGKAEISYTSTYGGQSIANSPHTMNAYEFATLTNETDYNAGKTNPTFSPADVQKYKDGTLPGTNWYDLVVRKSAPVQQHNLSATGGTDKIRYFLSLGYYDEQGIWKTGDLNYKRYNLRSNITAQLTNNLEAEMLINGIFDDKNEPGEPTWQVFKGMWMQKPTIPVYANNNPGYLSSVADGLHPLAVTDKSISGYTKRTTRTIQTTFALNYKIPFLEGLKARLMYSYDDKYLFTKQWRKKYALYDYDAASNAYIASYSHNPSNLSEGYDQVSLSTVQASLSYEKTFLDKHNVKALVLFEQLQQSVNNFNGSRQFSLDAVDQLYAGNTANQQVGSSASSGAFTPAGDPALMDRANQGVVGRLNYDFASKYLIEGSFRYDGSSKFAPGHRWGFFPAVSAGWRISEESFFKDNVHFINNLKLRGSIGKLGDDRSSSYQWYPGFTYPSGSYSVFDKTLVSGIVTKGIVNPNLTWFTSTTANVGLDADLLNGKLHVEVDVFRRQRTGLLATRALSLPGTVGAGLPQENLNGDLTKGLEVLLSHRNTVGKLTYNISGNIAFTRTQNLYVERAQSNNSYRNWRDNNSNRWSDVLFGYGVVGQFQSQDDINSSPIQDGQGNKTQLPGDIKYEDYNKDGIIDDNDVHPIARNNSTPGINFGTTVNLQWNGFDLNLLFQGATRFNVQYQEQLQAPLPWGRNGLNIFMDRWHKDDPTNPDSPWIPGKYPTTRSNGSFPLNYYTSSFWIHDATYLRLKSVEIGYTIPPSILGKKVVKAVRIYANGFNLVTWSGLNKVVDPEHTSATYGYEYPIMRSYNMGVNVTF